MDRQLRVTDDVCEQDMRDFQLNFLFNLGSHVDSRGNACDKDTLKSNLPIVEREGRLQKPVRTGNATCPSPFNQSIFPDRRPGSFNAEKKSGPNSFRESPMGIGGMERFP